MLSQQSNGCIYLPLAFVLDIKLIWTLGDTWVEVVEDNTRTRNKEGHIFDNLILNSFFVDWIKTHLKEGHPIDVHEGQ